MATPAELSLVSQIFAQVDKQKLGILNGDLAVSVFGGAKLPGSVLGEIWSIADEENNGWLSKTGAAKVIRLIGHAQKGTKISTTLLSKRQSVSGGSSSLDTHFYAQRARLPRLKGTLPSLNRTPARRFQSHPHLASLHSLRKIRSSFRTYSTVLVLPMAY